MSLELIVDPLTPPMSRAEFEKLSPPFSIALDGYVAEGPWKDLYAPRCNFNHHEGVSRMETRATCGQVLLAIRTGLFELFRDANGPRARVYVNDPDQDVSLAWFLIKNHVFASNPVNPLLNRLVHMEDLIDTLAGAYPLSADMEVLQEMAWIFEPYTQFRLDGRLDRRDAASYRCVIDDTCNRISRYLVGKGESRVLDDRYDEVGGGNGWVMVREHGAHARTGMFAKGVRAFVALRDRPDGRFVYSVGRMSEFIRFDVPAILSALSDAEGLAGNDRWGGGTTIGGSPRVAGSGLTATEVAKVIEEVLARPRAQKAR